MQEGEQLAEALGRLHRDFGYVRDGSSNKAAVSRGFTELFGPLRDLLQNLIDKMSSPAVLGGIQDIIARHARSRRELIALLRRATEDVYYPPSSEYLNRLAGSAQRPLLAKIAGHALNLVKEMGRDENFRGDTQDERNIEVFRTVLEFGIANIAYMVWALLEVIPRVYRQEGQALGSEAYAITAESTYPIITQMASSHDHVFHALAHFLGEGYEDVHLASRPPLKPDCFVLDGPALAIDPSLFEFVRMKLKRMLEEEGFSNDSPWVGCGGSFLFRPVFNGCMNAAKQSLFNQAERIVALPQEHEERFMIVEKNSVYHS